MSSVPASATGARVGGLRANSLAAVVMLLLQSSLGIGVDLYSRLPASDVGGSLPDGFTAWLSIFVLDLPARPRTSSSHGEAGGGAPGDGEPVPGGDATP